MDCFSTKRSSASIDRMFSAIYKTLLPVLHNIAREGILLMNEVVHCYSNSKAITHEWTIAKLMIVESVFLRRSKVHHLLEKLVGEIDLVWGSPRVNSKFKLSVEDN